ncbi:EVE domain-containing protein [Paraferrimonas sedimenticola]|uniref:DUF55 domain-containing protein n=1 Tax=Paraferrimonas sedimenticola TaxID=375674 RepID=A0AA37RZ75_9GAMM|nr:EVE domain-containing protein [Paraferrimonas sedimenticola]GLP97928.1 DUF55 domain-containing protein [Paraferrimonas sedimenticola]
MNYWLMKSEPDAFSIDDLMACPEQTEPWDGIRNYQARNMMRDDMRVGDRVFFYHSSCPQPGVVGIMQVASEPYPDPTQFDPDNKYHDPKSSPDNPRWQLVDVKFESKFDELVSLKALKANPELADMALLKRGNRLSIMPVSKAHWQVICAMAGATA